MIAVAFLNQKGGVGKTSLTHHIGGALAELGHSVLCLDWDPQASLTQGILGPDGAAALTPAQTSAAIARGGAPDPRRLILPAELAGIDLIPSGPELAAHNLADPHRRGARVAQALRHFLAETSAELEYRYCLIDCPPNLQTLAGAALHASEFLAIPTHAEDYGAQGIGPVLDFMDRCREDNPALALAGIIVNRRKRTSLHALYEQRIRGEYNGSTFRQCVPDLIGYCEAIAYRKPITRHDPKSNAADAMRALAVEFMDRTGEALP